MGVDELILVSVDDHVVEPPGFLEPHPPARYRQAAPQVEHRSDGTDFWVYDGRRLPNVGLNAVVGRPRDEYDIEPTEHGVISTKTAAVPMPSNQGNDAGDRGSPAIPRFREAAGSTYCNSHDRANAT